MIVIPAIDLRGGRCVRLAQGEFSAQTEYSADPRGLAQSYVEAGAACIHLVDLDGAKAGSPVQTEAIAAIASGLGAPVQAGGGIRRRGDLEDLFSAGVSRVVIGSVAVREPQRVATWIDEYGPEALAIALDVRADPDGVWRVASAGWTRTETTSLESALAPLLAAGACHLLCTDIGRDGMLTGPSLGLYRDLARAHPGIDIQASGGVADLYDITALAAIPVAAAIVGKALLEGRFELPAAIATAAAAHKLEGPS